MDQRIKCALSENRNLLEPEAMALLREYDIPVLPYSFHKSQKRLLGSKEIPYPAVVKVVSRDILHKSEVGGVKIGIRNLSELKMALSTMEENIRKHLPGFQPEGWIVYPQVLQGLEIIAGTITDKQFGACIMVGIGGIFTEALNDISFRVIPISRFDAKEMLNDLRSQAVLEGVRGTPGVDKEALASLLINLSRLVHENPEIFECDLNPVICSGPQVRVADARMVLNPH